MGAYHREILISKTKKSEYQHTTLAYTTENNRFLQHFLEIRKMTAEDRSLSSGMPIPKWMKGKTNDRFDFNQTTFSPTEIDDSFMYYYRHQQGVRSTEPKLITSSTSETISASQVSTATKLDFSRHPAPCQKYINGLIDGVAPAQTTPAMKVKSAGTDDGFKGEAAKCGSSIIRVASQMVSGKVVHGFNMEAAPQDDSCDLAGEKYERKRRGSRSLPASPLASPSSSPKGSRRPVNKYFTGAFTEVDKSKGGWILSNLLARRHISQSVGYINEETKEELERSSSTASVDEASLKDKNQVFKAKPSELREMNFWSPTSM
ncbi:hypothetical protein NQ317_005018 [Molorchus minor]|uniref:Uncharacterized protein n=1 Tax=Molorchus minor TaxID=1323400 RepID=A0ABQ9K296_9CUCU|nr:hypothetical protein NQ317_005018 [Molorchus minor]